MSPGALARRGVLLAITGVSLYLLAPALLEVFGAYDRLDEFNPLWWIAMVALQIGSYACMWAVQKLAMRAERWGPVITSQLASNSFGRVVPGGVAAAGAMQYAMLARGGVPAGAGGVGHDGLLGARVRHPAGAAAAGAAGGPVRRAGRPRARPRGADRRRGVPRCSSRPGAAAILWDRPLLAVGPGRAVGAQPHPAQANAAHAACPARLLRERNEVREVLGARWWEALLLAAGRWVLDYLTLLAALTAVHADPRPSTVLLAFCAAQFLGTLPLTPGGLGFVEAGLTGTLALAGVPGRRRRRGDARPTGWCRSGCRSRPAAVAALLHQRALRRGRRGRVSDRAPAAEQRERRGHAAADHEAGDGRADQRAAAVLGQLTAPVGQLGHLRAQVVDREGQLPARLLDRGADHLGVLARLISSCSFSTGQLVALDRLRLELGARQLGLLDRHRRAWAATPFLNRR